MKTNSEINKSSEQGFTLIELMIVAVMMIIILGILSSIIVGINRSYARERPRVEAVNNANAALDMMARLIRMAGNNPQNIAGLQAIDPGTAAAVTGQYNTIRIRSDWRCTSCSSGDPDGDTEDPFEDTTFSVINGKLMKREQPADTTPIEFLDHVNSLVFTYFDTNNLSIANPVTNQALIARVDIALVTQTPDNSAMTFRTSVYLRIR